MVEKSTEHKPKNKGIIIVTVLGAFLVVGLIVAAVVVGANMLYRDEATDGSDDDTSFNATELEANDESYQISSRISNVYNDDGDKEGALKMYDEELGKALEAGNYDLYIDLVIARSTMLSLDGTCEELMAQYDKIEVGPIPEEYRGTIYENAISDSVKCGDTDRETYWRSKANES